MDRTEKPRVAVLDYGMGNLRSVCRAWEHVGADVRLVETPDQIGEAAALIFPGQGAIADTMKQLRKTGFDRVIREWIAADRPFFGICLGLQALFEFSEEGGGTECLGIFPGQVRRFRLPRPHRVPHMGWNTVRFCFEVPELNADLDRVSDHFYFVHSYFADPADLSLTWGETDHGGQRFCAALQRGQAVATQFHPEKSQQKGLTLYRNFVRALVTGTLAGDSART